MRGGGALAPPPTAHKALPCQSPLIHKVKILQTLIELSHFLCIHMDWVIDFANFVGSSAILLWTRPLHFFVLWVNVIGLVLYDFGEIIG